MERPSRNEMEEGNIQNACRVNIKLADCCSAESTELDNIKE